MMMKTVAQTSLILFSEYVTSAHSCQGLGKLLLL